MACSHPLWIPNRRYFDKTRRSRLDPHDDHLSALALRPYDSARRWLAVPCGRCDDCLRRLRNDWFVRLERELSYQKSLRQNSVFITITIAPKYYEDALANPSSFIRKFNERIRRALGKSVKHAFFQEFGTHPESGTHPRLHFHGFLFGIPCSYNTIRSIIGDLGFIWITRSSLRRARYVVKYIVKQIKFNHKDVQDQYIVRDGVRIPLSSALAEPRYTRKFISAHVGDYLGSRPVPSYNTSSWPYLDFKNGTVYNYSIPRYYNKYMSETDALARAIRSAASYARLSHNCLLRSVISQCFKLTPQTATLSLDCPFQREVLTHNRIATANPNYFISPPAFIDPLVETFWLNQYKITLNYG